MRNKGILRRLKREKEKVAKGLPPLTEVMRGTFIKYYLECVRKGCKCHKGKGYRHGPNYRVSYGKKGQMHHIYVPLGLKGEVRKWTQNYNKIWQGIEDITELNVKVIRRKGSCKK